MILVGMGQLLGWILLPALALLLILPVLALGIGVPLLVIGVKIITWGAKRLDKILED